MIRDSFYLMIILIPLVAFLGYISYKDWKEKKIKNEHILVLLIGGVLFRLLNKNLFNLGFLTLFFYGGFISFLFWFVGIWPAGDAKLLISLLLFLPPQLYGNMNTIFNLFVNIFVPIFFFMVIVLLKKSGLEKIKEATKFTFDPYRVSLLILILIGFAGFILKGIRFLGLQVDYFMSILILFIAFEIVYTFLTFEMEIFLLGLTLLRLLVDFWQIFTYQYLIYISSLVLVFLFFRFFILYLAYYVYTKKIDIEELEAGMSLAEGIKKSEDGYEKKELLNFSLIGFLMQAKGNFIHSLSYLGKEDVKKLKELKESGDLEMGRIRVHQRQPFAVFLVVGFLITFFAKTSFINILKLYLIK